MAHTFSTESEAPLGLTPPLRRLLTQVARTSIEHGLVRHAPLAVHSEDYDPPLRVKRASFVTLSKAGELRGCIGAIAPVRPLVQDVAHNAYGAAFEDPRFPGLGRDELASLEIHISVLSEIEPVDCRNEADLLAQLRPGIDGLILGEGRRKGTFLPSVWEQLPEPRQFLAHLKMKAGLAADYWSDDIEVNRYTTTSW